MFDNNTKLKAAKLGDNPFNTRDKQELEQQQAAYELEQTNVEISRLKNELGKQRLNDLAEEKKILADIAVVEKEIKDKSKTPEEEKANAEDIGNLKDKVAGLKDEYKGLVTNGSQDTQTMLDNINSMEQKQIEMTKKAMQAAGRVPKETMDLVDNVFEQTLIEGKKLTDVLKNIRNEIAKIALKRLVYSALGGDPSNIGSSIFNGIFGAFGSKKKKNDNYYDFNTKDPLTQSVGQLVAPVQGLSNTMPIINGIMGTMPALFTANKAAQTAKTVTLGTAMAGVTTAMMTLTGALMANTAAQTASASTGLGGWMFHFADGGKIPGFASGGGLVNGAGTSTSDSILTYLANRGQFIKTSNGEYVVSKKGVDAVGINTLDMINSGALKGFATGGDIGEEMVPSMSTGLVDSYKGYTKAQSSMKNPNQKLEKIMEQQLHAINGISKSDRMGNVVILNTQADSNTIIKAIHDNPRAFQAVMGEQKKRRFR